MKEAADYSLVSVLIAYIANVSWVIYISLTIQSIVAYIGTFADWMLLTIVDFLFCFTNLNKEKQKKKERNCETWIYKISCNHA